MGRRGREARRPETAAMSESRPFAMGERVRLSAAGLARASDVAEAGGLHRAATAGETGEVIDVLRGDNGVTFSVAFPSGSVHNWPAECFDPDPDQARS